ncbi:MAG: hypothetical protein ACHQ51_12640 [Elusimicrobiota bacterium]
MIKARLRAAALTAVFFAAAQAFAQGPDEPLTGHVISVTSDGRLDIDIGDSGLKGGDVGVIQRDGAQIGLASVLWVDLGHTRLRVLSTVSGEEVRVGDEVIFADRKTRPNSESAETPASKAGPGTVAPGTEDFVPLLAPVAAKKTALTRSAGVFHGRLRLNEVYQTVAPSRAWYSSSRLDSDGSIERVAGGAWSVDWAGNASRRDGSVFSTADDYRKVSPHLYRAGLTRKWESTAFVRAGRFYPAELSGIGYVDGAQADVPLVAGLRLGAAAGARPDRVNMGFSGRENVAAAYTGVEAGEMRRLYYSGSLGVMRTLYRGKGDELAALWDQRADLGPKLNLFSTMQFDFNTGAAVEHVGTRLSRLNVNLNSPLTDLFSLRAGANHYEPLDTAADRELAGGTTFYLNNGYWRYWGGASQSLGAWQFDEDLSLTNTSAQWTPGQWRFAVGRHGLPGLPAAALTAAAYNLYNPAGQDYGGTLTAALPIGERFNLDANAGARLGPTSVSRRHFWISDASLHANWRPSQAWMFDAGATRSWQETVHSTIVNAGISWRW